MFTAWGDVRTAAGAEDEDGEGGGGGTVLVACPSRLFPTVSCSRSRRSRLRLAAEARMSAAVRRSGGASRALW